MLFDPIVLFINIETLHHYDVLAYEPTEDTQLRQIACAAVVYIFSRNRLVTMLRLPVTRRYHGQKRSDFPDGYFGFLDILLK